MSGRIQDKIAIITGAGSGIGEATAIKFAQEGAKVVIAEINSENGKKVADAINSKYGKAVFIETDVAKNESVKLMVDQTVKDFGAPDIMINNAGIAVFDDPLNLSEEDWRKCFSVDLDGVWYGCKNVLPHMLEKKKGSIVNIASVHAFQIIPKCFPYPIAKHGVLGLTRALAVDYAEKGIKINGIQYNKITIKIEKFNAPYTWIIFKMREGKNREIRKICEFFLWNIVKLVRIQYGSIKLIKQKPGEIVEVRNFSSTL